MLLKNKLLSDQYALQFLFLIIIAFISLFALLNNSSFGFIWDWGIPSNSEYLRNKFNDNETIWNNSVYGGFVEYFKFELWYWRLLFFLDKIFIGKYLFCLLFFFQILCILGIYNLCKRFNYKNFFFLSLFYLFSFFVYTKFIAGHLNILIFYWSLPIQVYFVLNIIEEKKIISNLNLLYILILNLFTLSHPSNLINYLIILLVIFLFSYLNYEERKKVIIKFSLIFLIFILSILHLITPLIEFLFSANDLIQTHRIDGSLNNEVQQTSKILDERVNQLLSKSNGFFFFLTSIVQNSMFYEPAFPHNSLILKIIFFLTFAFLNVLFLLSVLKNILLRNNIFLNICFLVTIFLFISGSNNILGETLFKIISKYLPEILITY